jgi:hypothetical protein
MSREPAPFPGRDEDPARRPRRPADPMSDETAGWRPVPQGTGDWMDGEQWAALPVDEEEPPDPELDRDPAEDGGACMYD